MRMTSEQRRASIVLSAIHLFAEKGFRGATTRELAAAAGVTEPVLYRHFRTKRDLYTAIIEGSAAGTLSQSSGLAAIAKRGDDREFFTAIAAMVLDRYQGNPELVRLLLYSCLERHELCDLFLDRVFLSYYKVTVAYIRRHIRNRRFRKIDPETATRGFIGMIAYHGLLALLFPGRFGRLKRKLVLDQMVGVFLDGIVA